ncbi:ArdC family protein [candidate division NPL-UPA2 bacterium]|nr:ArdC family protein [candidate division NPL-UPA2 bacterium]
MKTNKAQEILEKLLGVFESGELVNIIAKRPLFNVDNQGDKPSDNWSIMNQIIQLTGYTEDARGYKQWKKVGRQVKKGAKALYILAPIVQKRKKKNKETGEEEEYQYLGGFRYIPVFRYEDTEGDPLPGTQDVTPKTLPPLFQVAERLGVKIEYLPGKVGRFHGGYGSFNPREKKIHLFTQEDSTFFHELAHAAHASFKNLNTETTHEERETVAETVAAVLLVKYGQEINSTIISKNWNYLVRHNKRKPEKALKMISRVLNDIKKILEILLEENQEQVA